MLSCVIGYIRGSIIKNIVIINPFRSNIGGAFKHSIALVHAVLASGSATKVTVFTCKSNIPYFEKLTKRYKNLNI